MDFYWFMCITRRLRRSNSPAIPTASSNTRLGSGTAAMRRLPLVMKLQESQTKPAQLVFLTPAVLAAGT